MSNQQVPGNVASGAMGPRNAGGVSIYAPRGQLAIVAACILYSTHGFQLLTVNSLISAYRLYTALVKDTTPVGGIDCISPSAHLCFWLSRRRSLS
jgi:hypothetical protein